MLRSVGNAALEFKDMIKDLWIENFKGISKRQHIPLRPITLLFGANSAGKSTVTHALMFLKEILLHRNLDPVAALRENSAINLGGFFNLLHRTRSHFAEYLTIGVTHDDGPGAPRFEDYYWEQANLTKEDAVSFLGRECWAVEDLYDWELLLEFLKWDHGFEIQVGLSEQGPSGEPLLRQLTFREGGTNYYRCWSSRRANPAAPEYWYRGSRSDTVVHQWLNPWHTLNFPELMKLHTEALDPDGYNCYDWASLDVTRKRAQFLDGLSELIRKKESLFELSPTTEDGGEIPEFVISYEVLDLPTYPEASSIEAAQIRLNGVARFVKMVTFVDQILAPDFFVENPHLKDGILDAWVAIGAVSNAGEKPDDWLLPLAVLVDARIVDDVAAINPQYDAFWSKTASDWDLRPIERAIDRLRLACYRDSLFGDLLRVPESSSYQRARYGTESFPSEDAPLGFRLFRYFSADKEKWQRIHHDGDDLASRIRHYQQIMHADLMIRKSTVALRTELSRITYVGPTRKVPPRILNSHTLAGCVDWSEGLAAWKWLLDASENALQLCSEQMASQERGLGMAYSIRRIDSVDLPLDWQKAKPPLLDSDLSDRLESRTLLLSRRSRVAVWDDKANVERHPQDLGQGITQIIPVIVALGQTFFSCAGRSQSYYDQRVTLIEQPELHLHPSLAAQLGDLIISTSLPLPGGFSPCLIETHSEHLILRILRRIRQTTNGELPEHIPPVKPDDVCVLWVDNLGDGTTFTRLRISPEGRWLDRWPDGFFSERHKELF